MRVTIRAASPDDASPLAASFARVHGPHVAARADFFRVAPPHDASAWLVSLANGPSPPDLDCRRGWGPDRPCAGLLPRAGRATVLPSTTMVRDRPDRGPPRPAPTGGGQGAGPGSAPRGGPPSVGGWRVEKRARRRAKAGGLQVRAVSEPGVLQFQTACLTTLHR